MSMTAEEEDQPGPISSTACVGRDHNTRPSDATAADEALYPLDESPEKVAPSVAFAATEAEVLCTPEDGKKSTSNHRSYNALTNPVGDTIGSALNSGGAAAAGGDGGNNNKAAGSAGGSGNGGPSKAKQQAAPPSAAAAPEIAASAPSTAPASSPSATPSKATAAAAATPESSPQASRRLFQAMQAGTALPPSTDTSLASDDLDDSLNNVSNISGSNMNNMNSNMNDVSSGTPPPAAAGRSAAANANANDANDTTPVSAAAAAAAAAAQIRRDVEGAGQDKGEVLLDTSRERNRKDVVAMALNRRRHQQPLEEGGADDAEDDAEAGVPASASTTPPKHPAGTATTTVTSSSVHHPADESPAKALFRGGKPFQSSSGGGHHRSTPPSSSSRSRKVSPAKMHFASTAIPSPAVGGGGDGGNAEENSVVGGSNVGGANLDASILADQSFMSQGANTFVEEDDDADDDNDDIVDNRTDVSAEVDALDLAGISPIFVRAFGSCGAGAGGVSSRWKKRQQQKAKMRDGSTSDVAAAAANAGTGDDEAKNNTIANLREEIDCLKAKVKARDVGIVKLNGELSEATADLKHVRLMLQKEQRRNAAFGGAGEMSYSYSATTATSADGDGAEPTAATVAAAPTAADVASYKRQIEKQQEEIRNRDVRLNWMTKKMESLEVERCSLVEQLAEETKAAPATVSPTVAGGGNNTASGNEKKDVLDHSESSQPGRIGKADDTVALRLKLHESDSTIAALKAEINTMRSPELYARSQAAEVERLVQKAKRGAATIAALKSENTRLVMKVANGGDMRQEETDKAKEGEDPNQSLDEILGEVSRCVDPAAIHGDGPEDEFFGDSLVEDPTIRSMSAPPTDKVKIKSLEKKLREAKELELSMKNRLDVLSAALSGETSKVAAENLIAEQKEASNDEQKALIARMEKDIDDRDKSLEVLRSIIDSQKKEIKTQWKNAERWKEEELVLEEENKELKRTLRKAAKVVKKVEIDNLDSTVDVTMETDTSRDASQEGVEVMHDAISMVAFSVTKAQDKISQWMEKIPQCIPDDTQAAVGK